MNKQEVKKFFNKVFRGTAYSFDLYKTEIGYTVLLFRNAIPLQIICINKKVGLKVSIEEYLKGLNRILTIEDDKIYDESKLNEFKMH